MKKAVRTFSSAGKVSRGALLVMGVLTAAVAATAVVVERANNSDDAQGALEAGRRVQAAAEAWQTENANGCPTITQLMDEGRLDDAAATADPWGNRYRIICNGEHAEVRSAGPDRRPGTADDLTIRHGDS